MGRKTVVLLAVAALLAAGGCRSQDSRDGASVQAAAAERPAFRNLGKRGASAFDGGGTGAASAQR